jgi:hypothetical protein
MHSMHPIARLSPTAGRCCGRGRCDEPRQGRSVVGGGLNAAKVACVMLEMAWLRAVALAADGIGVAGGDQLGQSH